MKWLKTVMVVMTLGLWFLAANHCRLESLPGLEFLECASDTDSTKNCDGDGCETVENGFYKTESSQPAVPLPSLQSAYWAVRLLEETFESAPGSRIESDSAPPELPKIWQFSLRTALPPRAPSIAS